MAKALFKEQQKFRQKWIIAIIGIPLAISLWAITQQLILDKPYGDNPVSDLSLVLFLVVPLIILSLFFSLTLHTRISSEGIFYKFSPIIRKDRKLEWEDIEKVYVRKYKPIREYGGWGFRTGRSGKALNTSGNMGLQIEFKNGKRLLIGTQKPDEMERVLEKLDVKLSDNKKHSSY